MNNSAQYSLQTLEQSDDFVSRHIGPNDTDVQTMLDAVGASSLDELVGQTVPKQILLKEPLALEPACTEQEALGYLRGLADQNQVNTSYIGMGYYDTIVPPVILRNVLENPGWYTAYTPYQPEISQGRLEALLNYQQMVMDLTAMISARKRISIMSILRALRHKSSAAGKLPEAGMKRQSSIR